MYFNCILRGVEGGGGVVQQCTIGVSHSLFTD